MSENKEMIINGEKIPKELVEIILKRLNAMPPNISLAVLGKILTKEDIMKEIKGGSNIGKEILLIEIEYYKDLVRS